MWANYGLIITHHLAYKYVYVSYVSCKTLVRLSSTVSAAIIFKHISLKPLVCPFTVTLYHLEQASIQQNVSEKLPRNDSC